MEINHDQDGQIVERDAIPHGVQGETLNATDQENLAISGGVRKTRVMVYCRKLTALAPVEFDENRKAIGSHSSLYAYFWGQQVRNRFVCHVQVKGWEEYTSETFNHLWACIKEKC